MRVTCHQCGQRGRITKTNRFSATAADLYCQCTDACCGHTWVSTLAYSHTAKQASDIAAALIRDLSPDAQESLRQSMNARHHQRQLDIAAAKERSKPMIIRRTAP